MVGVCPRKKDGWSGLGKRIRSGTCWCCCDPLPPPALSQSFSKLHLPFPFLPISHFCCQLTNTVRASGATASCTHWCPFVEVAGKCAACTPPEHALHCQQFRVTIGFNPKVFPIYTFHDQPCPQSVYWMQQMLRRWASIMHSRRG